jgi:hypothetical protein
MDIILKDLLDENGVKNFWIESSKAFLEAMIIYLEKGKTIDINKTVSQILDDLFNDEDCKYIIAHLHIRFKEAKQDDGGIYLIQILIGHLLQYDLKLINLLKS